MTRGLAALTLTLSLALSVAGSARAEPVELSDAVTERLLEIHSRNPEPRDDAFSKMGGSSVASKAFLHCFATPYVDLGARPELAETLEYFNTGRRNSFNRQSEAAGVSWNLRYVLGGRPANFRQELDASGARWAFILFGGNDAQNENERVYAKRLVYLLEQIEETGVVPVLGSALPRRNQFKDRWIRRFNAITEAVAKHRNLPFIDYHGALSALPRKGLARDGVHPNVLGQGGLRAACQLTEKGLRYGNNVRNLLTLEMLDALRTSVPGDANADADADADAVTDAVTDAGSVTDAGPDAVTVTDAGPDAVTGTAPEPAPVPDPLPISALVQKSSLPPTVSLPKNCGAPKAGSRLYSTRVSLSAERTRLRASAFDLEGYKHRVFWVRIDDDGERCIRRRTQTIELDAKAGMWDFMVEVPERAAEDGQMLILIARDPR